MPHTVLAYSKTKVNKAGEILRRYQLGELQPEDDVAWAFEVLDNFRAAHQYPLTKATMGLRSMVTTERCRLEVSQRLKRRDTILDKLARQPEMALARMQDVGGCRAVLSDMDEVRRVQRRLRKHGKVKSIVDYVDHPAESGYRSVHVMVLYDERLVEVQLRTLMQHEWAVTVERLGGRMGFDLKSGVGPPEVLNLLEAISRAMALEEAGETIDKTLREEMTTLRSAAEPFLAGGGGR